MNLLAIIKKHNLSFCIISTLVLSLIVFLFLFGPYSLNPTYVDWVYTRHVDPQQHYLGWSYYRNAPWNFPFGMYDSLSYPIKTSIMNTDSIPLFAIFFKILSPILPRDFQYWGLWTLMCFMFQAVLGLLIIKKFTKNDMCGYIISILSSLCFILLPFYVMKVFWHSTMIAQWLILLCFLPIVYSDEMNTKQKIIIYSIIGMMAGAIHPYILMMCGLIILIYSVYEAVKIKKFFPLFYIVMFCIMALLSLYLIGVFQHNAYYSDDGLLVNGFNLDGFFNSMGLCKFFYFKYKLNRSIIGYAYFGAGILFLIAVAVCTLIMKLKNKDNFPDIKKYKKEIVAVLILFSLSFFLSLSPRVMFADKILFEIPLPEFLFNFWSIFRCTGSFIAIVNHIILISVLLYLIKNYTHKMILLLLVIAIILQVIDISPMRNMKMIPSPQNKKEQVVDSFDTPVFNKLVSKDNAVNYLIFDKYIYMNSTSNPYVGIIVDIARWARNRNIKLSYFYFSRELKGVDKNYFQELKNPKANEVFIFYDYRFFNAATKNITAKYYVYEYNDLIFARSVPVTGWEELEIDPKVYKKQRN